MVAKISESTELQVPIKNLIGMVVGASLATWLYFGVLERLNNIEHKIEMMSKEQTMNSEFRIRWPRGELGSLPADSEQFMLINHLTNEVEKLQSTVENGEGPVDRQQKLTMEFFERRIATLENELQKLKDKTMQLKNGDHKK